MWVVRAGRQTPEEVGPREAGEFPFFLPMSKKKCTGQLRR